MFGVVRRNPAFRRLWAAQVVSQAGDWLNRTAVLALIGTLSGPGAVGRAGLLFGTEVVLRLLPTAVLSPIAGPVADRLPRRALMVASDLVRAVLVLLLLLVDEPGDLPLLYALVAVQMGVSIFFDAARSASVPNTVPHEELLEANTLSSVTWSAMLALGAALGGAILPAIGVRGVFVLDAATFLASAWLLRRLPLPPVAASAEGRWWAAPLTDLRRALAHAREKGLAWVLWVKASWGMAGGYLALLSVLGSERFGGAGEAPDVHGEAVGRVGFAIGLLYAARGVGTGLGPPVARRLLGADDAALRLGIGLGFLVAAGGYALVPFAPGLGATLALVVLAHMGGSTIWVSSTVLWQRHVEDAFRGRVHTLEMLGMTLSFSAWAWAIGALYDATGSVGVALWTTSAAAALVGALRLAAILRRRGAQA